MLQMRTLSSEVLSVTQPGWPSREVSGIRPALDSTLTAAMRTAKGTSQVLEGMRVCPGSPKPAPRDKPKHRTMQVSAELFISQPGFKLPVSGRLSAPPTQPSRDSHMASPPGGTPQCKGQVLAAQAVLPLQPHCE